MVVIYDNIEQGSQEWLDIRRGKYTGSNAEKLLKYGAIDYSKAEAGSFGGNFFTKRGHILEDEAIELYQRIYRCTVARPGFITNTDYPGCGYSPDGLHHATDNARLSADTILLEVKCFNRESHMDIYKGEVPFKVLAQIHFGLFICNLREARLIIYNPELEPKYAFKTITVKANRNIMSNFKSKLIEDKRHAKTV